MKSGVMLVALSALLAGPSMSIAAVLYSETFESPVTTASGTAGPGGYVVLNSVGGSAFQVQGGSGGGTITEMAGVDNNGVGGSQALFANWDQSAANSYTYNQYTAYGVVNAPGAGTPLANIQISLDLFMSGSETSNTPINVVIQNGGDNVFTPTLTNGAFTHVVFNLSQTSGGAYDPANSSNFQVNHGAGGFGFDAGNVVRIDNVLVQTIPEPSTLMLLGLSSLALLFRRI